MRTFARVALVACLLVLAGAAAAAPEAKLWERWLAHDPEGPRAVDHRPWERFLETYLTAATPGVNRLDYAGVVAADRRRLAAYVRSLAALPISRYPRDAQLAYWINLYNAVTVEVVLDHYPVDSIRDIDISPGFFADGPWGRKLVEVEGVPLSLDDIEHRILRPIWRDARIHYAVNCTAVSCPDLRPEAYRAARIDAQLTAAARDYVNDPRGVRIADGRLVVSKLYDWYADDFGADEAAIIDHIRRYAAPALRARLEGVRRIDDYVYDWTLNEALTPPRSGPGAS